MNRSDLLSDFQRFVSREQWNEFVRHVQSTCVEKKRLLFWQETLWAKFTLKHAEAPQTVEEIIELFSRAKTVAVPSPALSREEFLADPWRHFCSRSATWDLTWLADAYRQPHFRRQFIATVARALSKMGDLNSYQHLLTVLAPSLAIPDAVELFLSLRGTRDETEWRAQFESLFPQATGHLPAVEQIQAPSDDEWSDDIPY